VLFRGLNSINLDAKGRMAIPSRYRGIVDEHCQGKMVVTIEATDGECLVIYPLNEYEEIQRKVEALPSYSAMAKRLKGLFIGHAADVELDSSGRILVPPTLRSYVNLDKKVVLVGQGKKFELWDEDAWNAKRESWLSQAAAGEEIPEEIKGLSL
jgi:MraZ protein